MLPQSSSASPQLRRVGVGIDTSRYGHYACFLHDTLQPAAAELPFAESAVGYRQLRERLEGILRRHAAVHFVIRLDAAGQYADNLLHFVHGLGQSLAAPPAADAARLAVSVSCGDPQRNKNYRAALFGNQKSDPAEARAAARYAINERPASVKPLSAEFRALRQIAGRLHAVVRQRTRLINQFHHLLALTFPELALLQKGHRRRLGPRACPSLSHRRAARQGHGRRSRQRPLSAPGADRAAPRARAFVHRVLERRRRL